MKIADYAYRWSVQPPTALAQELMFRLHAAGRSQILRDRRYAAERPYTRLLLGVAGHGTVTVCGDPLELFPGTCLFLPSSTETFVHMREGTEFYWVFFRCDYAGCVDFCSVVPPDHRRVENMDSSRTTRFIELTELLASEDFIDQFRCQSILIELLLAFYGPVHLDHVQRQLSKFQRFEPVFKYVQENLAKPISSGELAALVGLSTNYFSNLFSDTLGITPVQFVNQQRVLRAKGLLTFSALTVHEVASELGFNDPFYFSKVFKAATGVSPSHYRHQQEGLEA